MPAGRRRKIDETESASGSAIVSAAVSDGDESEEEDKEEEAAPKLPEGRPILLAFSRFVVSLGSLGRLTQFTLSGHERIAAQLFGSFLELTVFLSIS